MRYPSTKAPARFCITFQLGKHFDTCTRNVLFSFLGVFEEVKARYSIKSLRIVPLGFGRGWTSRRMVRITLVIVMLFVALMLPTRAVSGQTSAHLTITLTGQRLTGGFAGNVTITVLNNFYAVIYDVDITLSIPAPLIVQGSNHRHYDSMTRGQFSSINFRVYAPVSAIGNGYDGTVIVTYKQLGDISYTQESQIVGLSVRGFINLILYGVQITPSTTNPGGNATISGSLLNSGNVAAYNANVSIKSDLIDYSTSPGNVFIGVINPNIPRPFSLLIFFKSDAPVGVLVLIVEASAVDNNDPGSPYVVDQLSQIEITNPVPPSPGQSAPGILDLVMAIWRYLHDVFFGSLFSMRPSFDIATGLVQASHHRLNSQILL